MKNTANKKKNKKKKNSITKNKISGNETSQILSLFFVVIVLVVGGYFGYEAYINKQTENAALRTLRNKNLTNLETEKSEKRKAILERADYLFRGYYYDEAYKALFSDETLVNQEIISFSQKIINAKNSFVLFDGTVQHIFFHSLILYPEYLFPNLNVSGGLYASGFVYRRELERMLPQLMARGYVLYGINDVFGKDEDGKMRQKEIYLPEGKKPLILSVDDPSYHYGVGFARRMIIDENGELATEVRTPQGETIITYDGDVELVVNSFVRENPEFSYRGAKGIVASTGYLGFFGHRLYTAEARLQARAVANKLKETGWLFASHSFGHNGEGYWGANSDPANVAADIREWKRAIGSIVGETNIFIAPFGYVLPEASMEIVLRNGFDIYCNVGEEQRTFIYDRYVMMSRIELGGYAFQFFKDTLDKTFFNVDIVKDRHRPRQTTYGW
jgi:hypothetical protein